MAGIGAWVAGSRPRTWSAALSPILVGGAVAYQQDPDRFGWGTAGRILLALIVALALQIGVNFANDYSDGVRGTDSDRRGPARLVGQGLAQPRAVRRAAWLAFAAAGVAGLVDATWIGAWWLIAVGVAAVAAGWLYTGGPRPFGYAGLGEAIVFLFFGVVAVTGTAFVATGRWSCLAAAVSVPVGFQACALLVVNNLRDLETDERAGKRTLAVRLGPASTRRLFRGLITAPFVIVAAIGAAGVTGADAGLGWSLAGLAALPLAIAPWQGVTPGADAPALVRVLTETARLQLAFACLLAVGLVLGAAR